MSARTAKAPSDFLERYAREVDTLAADLDAFQDVLCRILSQSGNADGSGQALDEMAQRARALADVARRMAQEGPAGPVEELVAGVTLEDVLQRLSGSGTAPGNSGGELEFF